MQFSDVAVRVHVSDVNDNPPRFFQLNYSVVVQVSQEVVCSLSPCQGTKVLTHGLLLEQRGETAVKHAVSLCSLLQRTGINCRGRHSANRCHFLFPIPSGTSCPFSIESVELFPLSSLTCSPFLPCNCPHLHHNIRSRPKHMVKHHHVCWMQPSGHVDSSHL